MQNREKLFDNAQKALSRRKGVKIEEIFQEIKKHGYENFWSDRRQWLEQALKRIKTPETLMEAIDLTSPSFTFDSLKNNKNITKPVVWHFIEACFKNKDKFYWANSLQTWIKHLFPNEIDETWEKIFELYLQTHSNNGVIASDLDDSMHRVFFDSMLDNIKDGSFIQRIYQFTQKHDKLFLSFASNDYTPPNILEEIVSFVENTIELHNRDNIIAYIASNPNTPLKVRLAWFADPPRVSRYSYLNVPHKILCNPSTRIKIEYIQPETSAVKTFLLDEDNAKKVLENPSTPADVIEAIAKKYSGEKPNHAIIQGVLGHVNTPLHVLEKLVNECDSNTRENRIRCLSKKVKVTINQEEE